MSERTEKNDANFGFDQISFRTHNSSLEGATKLKFAPFCSSFHPSPPPPLPQTYIGAVVVSVNPYRSLGLCGADVMLEYRNMNLFEMPPHL